MRTHRIAIIASLFLAACWGGPSDDGLSSSSSSSTSSLAKVSSVPAAYSVEFRQQPNGEFLGSVTLTGYATVRDRKEAFCESNCKTFKYVLFNITDGANADLKKFLGNNEGNSYAGNGIIGLGCVSDDGKTIRSEVADPKTYTVSRTIDAADSAVILKSNARNLVSITLDRDYAPPGGGAPDCYSHFEYVTVTD